MNECLKELKHNQTINERQGLENRVNIDYVIERLESIDFITEFMKSEIVFNIENIVNDISNWQEDADTTKAVENLTDADVNDMATDLASNDFIINYINDILYETIQDKIYNYINKKEGK